MKASEAFTSLLAPDIVRHLTVKRALDESTMASVASSRTSTTS
jgi:hypothetical protein